MLIDKIKVTKGTGIKNTQGEECTLKEVLDSIKNGAYKPAIGVIQELLKQAENCTGKEKETLNDERKQKKTELPWFNLGIFNGIRKNDNIKESYGAVFDLDHVKDLEGTRKKLLQDTRIFAVFISPSGDGLKFIILFDKPITNKHGYRQVYMKLCKELMDKYDIDLDLSTKDVSRGTFLSYDPDIYINENPELIKVDNYINMKDVGARESARNKKRRTSKTSNSPIHIIDKKVIKNLKEMAVFLVPETYEEWMKAAFALNNLGEAGRGIFHIVSRNNSEFHDSDEDIDNKYNQCNQPEIGLDYFINLAVKGGYDGPIDVGTESYCDNNLFLLPAGTDINSFFYKPKKQSAILFNEAEFRRLASVNKDIVRHHGKDFMIFSGGVWKQIRTAEIASMIRQATIGQKPGSSYADDQIKRTCNFIQDNVDPWNPEDANKHLYDKDYLVITQSKIYKINRKDLSITIEQNKGQYYNFLALPDFDYSDRKTNIDSYFTGVAEIDQFLKGISMNDITWIKVLQEVVGYCLLYGFMEPKIYFGTGPGSNGKSVLTDMITQIIGAKNISSIKFSNINEGNVASMERCFLNIPSELSGTESMKDEILKAIADGNAIQANEKYLVPRVVNPIGKLFAFANKLPPVSDSTRGFWRRSVVIPFDMDIRDDDPNKIEKKDFQIIFYNNRDVISIWALNGLLRLIKRKGLHSKCERITKASVKYRDNSNSVALFMDAFSEEMMANMLDSQSFECRKVSSVFYSFSSADHMTNITWSEIATCRSGRVSIKCDRLFNSYRQFCKAENCHAFQRKNFIEKLEELCNRRDYKLSLELKRSNSTQKLFFSGEQLWLLKQELEKENIPEEDNDNAKNESDGELIPLGEPTDGVPVSYTPDDDLPF